MLQSKTVLVLGAGASCDYGFPTGQGLTKLIRERLTFQYRDFGPMLESLGFTHDQLYDFQDRVSNLDLPSLDVFLMNNRKLVPIAKAAIAVALIPLEKEEALQEPSPPNRHWYKHLFKQMVGESRDGPSDFKISAHRLRIITFNYDRSLEYYFQKALVRSFTDEREADLCLKSFCNNIRHVYGCLGKPNFLGFPPEESRPFDTSVTPETIVKCMNSMEMVDEKQHNLALESLLRDTFDEDTKIVCFLGFGYAQENIRRVIYPRGVLEGKSLYGTAFGLSPNSRSEVTEQIAGITLGDSSDDVLTFLKKHPVLISGRFI